MGINFGALPTESGSGMKPGYYKVVVVDSKMRTPKAKSDGSVGPDYLELKYQLFDYDGNKKGTMFDRFFDSDAQALQYKLGRLNYAADLRLVTNVELKDLAKLMPGKAYVVKTKEQLGQDKKPNGYLEVDLFDGEIFFREDEFAELIGHDDMVPFSTEDPAPAAAPAPAPADTGTY